MTEARSVSTESVLVLIAGGLLDSDNRPVVSVVEGPGAETDGRTFDVLSVAPSGPVVQPTLVVEQVLASHRQPPQLQGRVYGAPGFTDGAVITTRPIQTFHLPGGQKLSGAESPERARPGTPVFLFRAYAR